MPIHAVIYRICSYAVSLPQSLHQPLCEICLVQDQLRGLLAKRREGAFIPLFASAWIVWFVGCCPGCLGCDCATTCATLQCISVIKCWRRLCSWREACDTSEAPGICEAHERSRFRLEKPPIIIASSDVWSSSGRLWSKEDKAAGQRCACRIRVIIGVSRLGGGGDEFWIKARPCQKRSLCAGASCLNSSLLDCAREVR